MISEERKDELVSNLQYYVERFLSKNGITCNIIEDITENEEEEDFLHSCIKNFEVIRGGE